MSPACGRPLFPLPTARCGAMVRGTAALSPCWGRLVPPRRRPGWRKLLPSGGNIWPGQPRPRDLGSHARRDLPGLWAELRPLMAHPTGEQAAVAGAGCPSPRGPGSGRGRGWRRGCPGGSWLAAACCPGCWGTAGGPALGCRAAPPRSVPQPEKWFAGL